MLYDLSAKNSIHCVFGQRNICSRTNDIHFVPVRLYDVTAGITLSPVLKKTFVGFVATPYIQHSPPGISENRFFEIPDQAAALRQIHRALRPGGILAVAEVFGIDPHYQSPQTVQRLGLAAGFEPGERLGPWWFFTQRLIKPLRIVERHQDA